MGFIVSSTGSFTSGFVVMAGLAVAGALLMLLVPRERVERSESATVTSGA